jgi:RNA polymerase sigma-70 factor (ECF subfamily)
LKQLVMATTRILRKKTTANRTAARPRTAKAAVTPVEPIASQEPDDEEEDDLFTAVASRPAHALDFATHCLPLRDELYGVAMRMTRSPSDAQDLVQETLLRAFVAWGRFEPGSNCRAWMFRILTNSFINIYRKRRRHNRFATERHGDAVAALYGTDIDCATDAAHELLTDALGDEVTAALSTLDADYREVVELADLRGRRYRDIADDLDVPIGTVMSRLFRARRLLEAQLAPFAAADYGIRRAA